MFAVGLPCKDEKQNSSQPCGTVFVSRNSGTIASSTTVADSNLTKLPAPNATAP
jgi:hypothetical protein